MIKNTGLKVYESKGRGRGVFATKEYSRKEIIEKANVLVFSNKDEIDHINSTQLENYTYQWGDDSDKAALVFGHGSLYNHSYSPNAMYFADHDKNIMTFVAIKNIKTGDEITVNYNGDHNDSTPVWFDSV